MAERTVGTRYPLPGPPGDCSTKWSGEWVFVADVAIQLARAVSVPRGTDTPVAELAFLLAHAEAGLRSIEGLRLLGNAPSRIGVVSFLLGTHTPYDVGTLLDARGIAVRTGHHCAQPLMAKWGLPGTVRASFGVYTTEDEVDALIDGVRRAARVLG